MKNKKDMNAESDETAAKPDETAQENSNQGSMPASAFGEGLHGLDQILAPSEEVLAEAMERGFYRFKHDELEHQQDKVDQ